jgi:hypothetical protein
MGKLNFDFVYDGLTIEEIWSRRSYLSQFLLIQHLKHIYNVPKLNEIEIEGEDQLIKIDIAEIKEDVDVDLESINFPDDFVKGKMLEIKYYRKISDELIQIEQAIACCTIEDLKKVLTLASNAIQLIKTTASSSYLSDIELNRDFFVNNLNHILSDDLDFNFRGELARKSESQVRPFEIVARLLIKQISLFRNKIDEYKVN